MSQSEGPRPYDFSNWEIGEDALSSVEVAMWELIEQARDKTLRLNWPDFAALHRAVLNLVQEELAYAFQEHRSGVWCVDVSSGASVKWHSEIDQDDAPTIVLKPTQLVPLIMGPLSARLSQFPVPENIAPQPLYSAVDEDFDWDANWELAFAAAKQWQGAVISLIRGLKALRVERREREAEVASRDYNLGREEP